MIMRPVILFFFLLPSLHGLSQVFYQSDEPNNLSGSNNTTDIIRANKIRKEMIYAYSSQEKDADSLLMDSIVYNSRGQYLLYIERPWEQRFRVTRKYFYDSLGRVYKIYEDREFPREYSLIQQFAYDSTGREKANYIYDVDTIFVEIRQKAYDMAGKPVAIYQGSNKTPPRKYALFSYSYITGLLEKVVYYYLDGQKSKTHVYTYARDARERKIVEIGKGTSHLFEESFFDEQGKVTRTISRKMYRGGIFESVFATFSYNPDGTLFEWTEYRGKNSVFVFRHYYETD
jgi:hypothetical protein